MGESKTTTLTVRIDESLKKEIEKFASQVGKSVSDIVREALELIMLAERSKNVEEAVANFVAMILRRYPEFEKNFEWTYYEEQGVWKRPYKVIVKAEKKDFDRLGMTKEVRSRINITVCTSEGFRVWSMWVEDSEYPMGSGRYKTMYYFSYPPSKREFDIINESLKRILI